ncbi:MAG: mycofactocin-coupled SDR family oxidoreductase [Pelotomaculum sp.]|nr:mycofactocin-coupled SDR family oxidoreductase [Pelotomaculum sp.]
MGKLDGKVAFITGAARGQGRAAALAMAGEGADIACFDICRNLDYPSYCLATREDMEVTVSGIRALGRKAAVFYGDVRRFNEVRAAVEGTIEVFGKIDILLNNAGIAGIGASHELKEEEWDTMLDINLKGVWLCCKAVIPHMIERKGGVIISTSSVNGVKALPYSVHYTCAKWGVIGLTKTLAQELAPYNIRVNSISPGTVATRMVAGLAREAGLEYEEAARQFCSGHLISGLIPPEAVAAAALWLSSEEARYITGHNLLVDGGWAST